jgi:hypothetical protein
MEILGQIVIYALLGVVIFLLAGMIGFRIPAPLRWPDGSPSTEVQYHTLPAGLPQAARRWLSNTAGEVAAPETLVAWGRGKIASNLPILGRIWLPLSWTMYLAPGSEFIIENRITWFGRRFIRGGEEFRQGRGEFLLGSQPIQAPYLDETERRLCWLYSIWLAPGSLLIKDGVVLSENRDGSLRILVSDVGKPDMEFSLYFEPSTGNLASISTMRKGSRTGDDYPYQADLNLSKNVDPEIYLPTRYTGDWDGDIYIKLELVGLHMNQPISEAMQTGIANMRN